MAPELGATFVPGGFDDYYMPEVVAPSPQRYVQRVRSWLSFCCRPCRNTISRDMLIKLVEIEQSQPPSPPEHAG
jgi:hypothetical protein